MLMKMNTEYPLVNMLYFMKLIYIQFEFLRNLVKIENYLTFH